ncbi:High-affinity glucose transporter ght5 [Cladobotryum mycophilum]|uniref:High-affinity glucose transporter ght5 n=1 Tax=Cladobotryum mycophilum TaxID=491253 RepID=A0ABR0S8N0_9HYPO
MVVFVRQAEELSNEQPARESPLDIRAGYIMYLTNTKINMPENQFLPPTEALGHPVVVLLTSTSEKKALIVTVTSLGGRSIMEKFPFSVEYRATLLPVFPSEPHPDTGERLELEYSSLHKSSYVRLAKVYVVPWSVLKPFGDPYEPTRFTTESLSMLVNSLPTRWRDEIGYFSPSTLAPSNCKVTANCPKEAPKETACSSMDGERGANEDSPGSNAASPPSHESRDQGLEHHAADDRGDDWGFINNSPPYLSQNESVESGRLEDDEDASFLQAIRESQDDGWLQIGSAAMDDSKSTTSSHDSTAIRTSRTSITVTSGRYAWLQVSNNDEDEGDVTSSDESTSTSNSSHRRSKTMDDQDAESYDEEKRIEGVGRVSDELNGDKKRGDKDKKRRRRKRRSGRRGGQHKVMRNVKICGIMFYLLLLVIFLLYSIYEVASTRARLLFTSPLKRITVIFPRMFSIYHFLEQIFGLYILLFYRIHSLYLEAVHDIRGTHPAIHPPPLSAVARPRTQSTPGPYNRHPLPSTLDRVMRLFTCLKHSIRSTLTAVKSCFTPPGQISFKANGTECGIETILLGLVTSLGGFLVGYEVGQIAPISQFGDWQRRFAFDETRQFGELQIGFIFGLPCLGSLLGSLASGYIAGWWGRRKCILVGVCVYTIGTAIQTTAVNEWVHFMMGRFVSGLGVGNFAFCVPMFQAESAPREVRGQIVSLFQLFLTLGLLSASIVGMCVRVLSQTPYSWRILIGAGSPVALLLDRARASLSRLRGMKHDPYCILVENDLHEMREVIDWEIKAGEASWLECFSPTADVPKTLYRTMLVMSLHFLQQWTGINYFIFFGPTIFESTGVRDSFITQIILCSVNFVMSIAGITVVKRYGRRRPLFIGAMWQAVWMVVFATSSNDAGNSPAGLEGTSLNNGPTTYIMLISAVMFITSYASTWGPLPWLITGETFPLRTRTKQGSLAITANSIGTFLVNFFVPFSAARGMSYRFSFILIFTNIIAASVVWFFLYESAGLSLENVDLMYSQDNVNPKTSPSWVPPGYITRTHRDERNFHRMSISGLPQDKQEATNTPEENVEQV